MCHSRRTNNKINGLHERALTVVYDDGMSTFGQLLTMNNYFCVQHQNIQRFLIKIYKSLHDNSASSLKETLIRRNNTINMRSKAKLVRPSVNFVLKDKNSLRYFGSSICNSLPIEIREDHSTWSFVTKIKQWKPTACLCTICKSYRGRVRYIKVSEY